jgi:hypothetical protein
LLSKGKDKNTKTNLKCKTSKFSRTVEDALALRKTWERVSSRLERGQALQGKTGLVVVSSNLAGVCGK